MSTLRNPEYQELLRRNVYLPLLSLVLQLLLLVWLVAEYGSQAQAVDNSLRVIADANNVLRLTADAETGLQGYRASKDRQYLQPYNWAKVELPGQLYKLRDELSDTPALSRRVDQIESQKQQWLTEADRSLNAPLGQTDLSAALHRRELVDQFRLSINRLIGTEQSQLNSQENALRRQTIFLSVMLVLSVLAIGGFLGYQSHRTVMGLSDRYESLLEQVEDQSGELRRSHEGLELRVRERTSELESANKELEQFTYAVAHDLRAPLRWIVSANDIFREDYGHLVPGEAIQELNRVNHAAVRLSTLIDNLLEFAHFGKVEMIRAPVDVTRMAESIAEEFAGRDWGGHVTCEVQKDMRAKADPSLLHVVFQNLIENAFKFSGHSKSPRVHVTANKDDGEVVFHVHDNGVGFDMRQREKLFTPFERLHARGKYEGSGIGLANAQRIIERHGGRIWAESSPEHGTTFSFTLGDAPIPKGEGLRRAKTGASS